MRILLAIESSTDIASVALSCPAPVPASPSAGAGTAATAHADQHATLLPQRLLQRQVDGVQSHSLTVLPMVQALLAEAGITLAQCDTIAFGAGPGSFTGVRTACGIAQGLAYGCGRPVVAVDTLAAAAQACRDASGSADVLVIIDARMGQVYWGRYRWLADADVNGGEWQAVAPARVDAPEAVVAAFTAGDFNDAQQITPCGNGLSAYAAALAPLLALPGMQPGRAECMPHAVQVAALAHRLAAQGKAVPAREAQPVYLRNDVALTTAERAAKRAADLLDAAA